MEVVRIVKGFTILCNVTVSVRGLVDTIENATIHVLVAA